MDRFVIRNPKPVAASGSKSSSGSTRMKQATIESLGGVVVIEDILAHKSKLILKTSSNEEKVHCLNELGKKIPPRHVMLDTKIGKVVSKLRNHEDAEVSKAAKRVYVKWRKHFEDHINKPLLEVKCDLKTEKLRNSGKELLVDALGSKDHSKLAEAIERETFLQHERRINNNYRRSMRGLVFLLRNQEAVRVKVISGETTVTNLVKEYKK